MKHYLILLFIISIFKPIYGQSVVPLSVGNKWIYNVVDIRWYPYADYKPDTINYVKTYEILSDTIVSPDLGTNIKCYKVKKFDSYEYWGANENRFYLWPDDAYNFYFFSDKYNTQIKRDTILEFGEIKVKTYNLNFLNIQNREAQEWSSTHVVPHFSWTSYYTTALNFGIVKIKFITESGTYTDTTISTIKGAIINGMVYGDTITTSIRRESSLNFSYELAQNYPNPFNPSTKIEYSIPKASFVTLKVYDVLGREVATLVNEEKAVGRYEVEFNGNSLSSGIYFYKIQAGEYASVKKMILIR